MEINWSTFVLEIINFLVLVWILKKFFYAPIKNAILRRQEAIKQNLKNADNMRDEAATLQQKYENRLIDWEKEKENQKIELQHELGQEQAKRKEELQKMLQKEKEKNQVLEQRRIAAIISQKEKATIENAMKFIAQLLAQFAGPELENNIIDLFVKELQGFSEEQLANLQEEIKGQDFKVIIKTAFLLAESQQNKLTAVFEKILNGKMEFQFEQNPELLAGAYVELGPIVFHLNLRDELEFFAKVSGHE